MNKNTKHISLKNRLLSKDNIFKAIYTLDSYVFERGLLCDEDKELLCRLKDCHNKELIDRTIEDCQKILEKLLTEKDFLFDLMVYFRFKSKDKDGTIKYRPLHITSLKNLICMIAMLRPLMLDEQGDKIHLSGLCKLIPHNFYGNLPSTKSESLFIPWKIQYKKYTEDILQRYKILTETKEYTQEVCLDLKDFFPSISPYWMYQYALEKLKPIWTEQEDIDCLKQFLCKLLFFKILNEDMHEWETVYYPKIELEEQTVYYNRGIAQGLPQSYFFGNLAMIEIAKLNASTFHGESYYYVDDSVIYTNGLDENIFAEKIQSTNKAIESRFNVPENIIQEVDALIGKEVASFQHKLAVGYKIKLHDTEKSFYCEIQEKDGTHGGILPLMAKEVSIAGHLFDNMDKYDDQMSLSKINALLQVITHYLQTYQKQANSTNKQSQIKMLKRYRKFFLFRKKFIMLKTDNLEIEDSVDNFKKSLENSQKIEQLLENFDQEIFMAEAQLLLANCTKQKAKELLETIEKMERRLFENPSREHLYFHTTLAATQILQKYQQSYSTYDTLRHIMRHAPAQLASESQKIKTLQKVFSSNDEEIIRYIYPQLPDYATNVCTHSDEFKRKILNAYLSAVLNVDLDDAFTIYKKNSFHTTRYFDVRVLAFVRNKVFKMDDFRTFILSLLKKEQQYSFTGIDANLLSILGLYVHKVRNPRHVDSLICTHQLVSGLWMNGSKFMHQYTLHNQDHAITLIRLSLKLIKHIDYLGLKQNDFFVLFLACYLHDISMVINPQLKMFNKTPSESDSVLTKCIIELHHLSTSERKRDMSAWKNMLLGIFGEVYDYFENAKRKIHADESANFVLSHSDNFFSYIEPAILQLVANIGASHGYDTTEIYGRRSTARNELFSVKYLMILLRLADVMDITSERVNYYLLKENFQHFSTISKFHWISHHITNYVEPLTLYTVTKNKNVNIQEKISIIMELNTNNLVPFTNKKMKCESCKMRLEEEDTTKKIILSIGEKKDECTYPQQKSSYCPLLCVWTRKKHDYLFNELIELKKYINQVNLPLFNTDIEVVIKLAENDKLDPEFFDAVLAFLEQKT